MLHPILIIDKDNHPTGERSDPEDATNRGLWHRGAHVVIFNSNGDVLVQKRSLSSIQHPGMIDIGVGGFVDSDETPKETVVRETLEETGLHIPIEALVLLGTTKYNHRWRFGTRQKISRSFIYTYAVTLPKETHDITTQPSEVEWVKFIPLNMAKRLVTQKTIRSLGKLLPTYAYYNKVLRQSLSALYKK
jgi:ADP-ribose pyrophosphatase YjhB (NUDIX family)